MLKFSTNVQALWASVVGASPLPDVFAVRRWDREFCIVVLHGRNMVLHGLSVITLLRTMLLHGLSVNALM